MVEDLALRVERSWQVWHDPQNSFGNFSGLGKLGHAGRGRAEA